MLPPAMAHSSHIHKPVTHEPETLGHCEFESWRSPATSCTCRGMGHVVCAANILNHSWQCTLRSGLSSLSPCACRKRSLATQARADSAPFHLFLQRQLCGFCPLQRERQQISPVLSSDFHVGTCQLSTLTDTITQALQQGLA